MFNFPPLLPICFVMQERANFVSLNLKISSALVGISVLLFAVIANYNYHSFMEELEDFSEESFLENLNTISGTIVSLKDAHLKDSVFDAFSKANANRLVLYVDLKSDKVIYSSDESLKNEDLTSFLSNKYQLDYQKIKALPNDRACIDILTASHFCFQRILENPVEKAYDKVVLGVYDYDHLYTLARNELIKQSSISGLIVILFTGLFYQWLKMILLQRIDNLRFKVKSWLNGDRNPHDENSYTDEVTNLTRELNSLIETLKKNESTIQVQQIELVSAAQFSALGEMAGGIAHEINNPLAIISARAQITAKLADKSLALDANEKLAYQNNMKTIVETSKRVKQIIDGLRKFSENASTDEITLSSIKQIIDESLSLCREKFHNKGIYINLEIPESNLEVWCRPTQINQVIVNLLNNAYDALEHRESGRIVGIKVERLEDKIRLRIQDNGPGIPAAIKEKIMQPFFTTKGVGKGTGLGLSVAKGIIESHGGKLGLEPSKEGTSFLIELPVDASIANKTKVAS